jgi:N-acetyl-alpha-D-glucosaminyl L-malate synthase BshA
VTAISNYLKQATIDTFHFDRIQVIPNFVCPSEYKPKIDCDLRQTLAPDDVPILVHVSNFRPVKRPLDCIEILARVLKKTEARLVMVGDGSERTNAIHLAKSLHVYDQCVFVGKQPRIVDYLCASDLLLLPSEQESFGLAALEAMAVQLPVIASRVGGIPEVVDDGETGFLSAVGDVDKMAEDVVKLLTDPKLRREMGKRARESAVSRYRTELVIPQYIEFYDRVIAQKGK